MASYTNLSSLFSAIADAIRDREGSGGAITASSFPERISALSGPVPEVSRTLTISRSDSNSYDVLIQYPFIHEVTHEWTFVRAILSAGESVDIPIPEPESFTTHASGESKEDLFTIIMYKPNTSTALDISILSSPSMLVDGYNPTAAATVNNKAHMLTIHSEIVNPTATMEIELGT